MSCSDPDTSGLAVGRDPYGYGIRGTTTGRGGPLVDTCDENGNLIERYCFFDRCFVDDCGSNLDVREEVIECPAGCEEGSCFTWCPPFGRLLVASLDDGVLVVEHESGQRLRCEADWPTDEYDCSSANVVGTSFLVEVTSTCEPIFRIRAHDVMTAPDEFHACEFLCYAIP